MTAPSGADVAAARGGRSVFHPVIPHPEDREGSDRYRRAWLIGVTVVCVYLFGFIGILARTTYDTWAAFMFAPLFFVVGAAILRRLLNIVEPDRWIHRVVVAGLGAKLLGGFARFYTNELFLGHADAKQYYQSGSALAAEFRSFVFGGPAFQTLVPDFTGTRFIRLLVGVVYTVTGSTHLGGYIVFSFMSFWGLYLFYRAYCIAMPGGLRRRYAVLVFFMPSVVFWPSSIGKEAWMTTMLGIACYGLARLLTHQRGGYLAILVSFAGMGVVRPHVAAIVGVGVAVAFGLRRNDGGGGGAAKKILGILLLAIVAGVLINQLQSYFGLDSGLDATAVFDETNRRTSQGGSEFQGAQPQSPAELPWAIVTVLFRPFLFEARGVAGIVTALEGMVLLGLFVWNAPRLARLPAMMIARPYVAFALVYTLVFAFAFSAISNFGILARQRTQLFPIAVVVLTVPFEASLATRGKLLAERQQLLASSRRKGRTTPGRATSAAAAPGPAESSTAVAGSPSPEDRTKGRQRPLPYLTVRAENRDQGPQPDGGQGQRGPVATEDAAKVGERAEDGPKPIPSG